MPGTPVTGVITAEAQESFTGQPYFQAGRRRGWTDISPAPAWDTWLPDGWVGVLDEHPELGREPMARRDVEARYRVRRVLVAVSVGDRAIGVAVRVAVRVGQGGVVAVGLARGLDPHVGVQVRERRIRA